MLVHKGGKIKNWGLECRDVTPKKSLSLGGGVGSGGGQGGWVRVDVNAMLGVGVMLGMK